MKLKRNIAVLALMAVVSGLAMAVPGPTGPESDPTADQNTLLSNTFGVNTGILDIKSGPEAGMGVENRHIENGTYRAYLNPGQFTETTSGNVYLELGNRTGVERSEINNTAHRNQWGGVSYGGKKWGSFGVFVGRPYSGVAGRHNTDLYTGIAIPTAINAGATGIATLHLGARGLTVGTVDTLAGVAPYADFAAVTAGESSLAANAVGVVTPEGKVDFFYGYKPTDKISVGAMFEIESGKVKTQDNVQTSTGAVSTAAGSGDQTFKVQRRTSDFGITFGATAKELAGRLEKVDLSLRLNWPKVNNTITQSVLHDGTLGVAQGVNTFTETLKSGRNLNVSVLGRAVVKVNDSTKFIPFFSYARQKADLTDRVAITTGTQTTLDMTDTRLDKADIYTGEWAINSKITERTLLVVANGFNVNVRKQRASRNIVANFGQFAAGADYTGGRATVGQFTGTVEDDEFKANTLSIPVWIAVEHQVSRPFTLRTGVFKNIYSKTTNTWTSRDFGDTNPAGGAATYGLIRTNTQKTFTDNQTPAVISVGLGAKVTEDFTLDAVVQKNVFFTGSRLASGITDPLFTSLSARYRF